MTVTGEDDLPGSPEYGDIVFDALALDRDIEDLRLDLSGVSASEYDALLIVRSEQRKYESFKHWQHTEEMKRQQQKHG